LAQKVLVTAALPYANDRLHLGHLRSTYIPSDIYVRYLRLRGYDVRYICASDEHGTPIAVRAEREGKAPKEIVDEYHALIEEDLRSAGCSFDIFSRTTYPFHYKLTQAFFKHLCEKNYIYEADYEQLYCSKCDRFLPDRYVEGVCPYCGAEGARGDACDACGRYLKPTELIRPFCTVCRFKPEIRRTKHWFLKLSAFQKFLEQWIAGNERLPANVRNYASGWLNEGLKDWCITRDLSWGVPVPLEGGEGKVIYVWFDAPIGYISSTENWSQEVGKPDLWREYWADRGCQIIHFIGKDIIYHHAIFWPAMLEADGEFSLPTNIVAGEYLTLEGKKLSKSRGWVVRVEDYMKEFDPDSLRYYLTAVAPLDKDADFSWEEYARKRNDELADILGNFVHRALTFAETQFGNRVPEPGPLESRDKDALSRIAESVGRVADHLDRFDFHGGLRAAMELAAYGNRYLNETEPWKVIKAQPKKAATAIYVALQAVKALAVVTEPFLPYTAERIWSYLKIDEAVHSQSWSEADKRLESGHQLAKSKPLFAKLRPDEVEEQKRKLEESLRAAVAPKSAPVAVTLEDLSKLDLRVAEIVEVVRVPGSEKLFKLKVDIGGGETRVAVTALAHLYRAEDLKGKLAAVIVNLAPTTIFGVTSEVMILAAEDDEGYALLQPSRKLKPGSRIK